MSLTSEMARIAEEFSGAQTERRSAIKLIGANLRRQRESNVLSLANVMAAHRRATKGSLRDLFGKVAFTRGAAEDMMERLRKARKTSRVILHRKLKALAVALSETTEEELKHLKAEHRQTADQEAGLRRAAVADMRRQVVVQLRDADKILAAMSRERQRAAKIWKRHAQDFCGAGRSGGQAGTKQPQARASA
jgi:hypothetical protein